MYDLVSFVIRGKVRKQVLMTLEEPTTPTQLAQKLKNHRSTISRALLELENKKIVRCLTPNERMARFYEITKMGEKIRGLIKK